MAVLEENDILFALKALNLMPKLGDATRRVAGAIIDHFNKRTGQCDPSIERLATLLGIDRATVMRATEKLDELGLIEKFSHGGKSHRAAYLPNWGVFRAFVEEWDQQMKAGSSKRVQTLINSHATSSDVTHVTRDMEENGKVAKLRRSQSQDCDVKGRSAATQTLRSNQSNKPIENISVQCARSEKHTPQSLEASQGLWRGNTRQAQRSMLLPLKGGKQVSHADAAKAAAERRWYAMLHALGEKTEADVLNWMTEERQEAATQAEMKNNGAGLLFIVQSMKAERMAAHG